MTFGEYITGLKVEATKKGQDFAYAALRTEDDLPVEVDVRWLEPGGYMTEFPGPLTASQKDAGQHWDTSWTFVRCAPQPAPTRVSLPAGRFVPGGLPDIKFDA